MQGQAQDLGGNWLAAGDLNFSERYLAAVQRLVGPIDEHVAVLPVDDGDHHREGVEQVAQVHFEAGGAHAGDYRSDAPVAAPAQMGRPGFWWGRFGPQRARSGTPPTRASP
jgi:hypothetical protein